MAIVAVAVAALAGLLAPGARGQPSARLSAQGCDPAVQYDRYHALDHIGTATPWTAGAVPWLAARFGGVPAPANCAAIPAGNPVAPIG